MLDKVRSAVGHKVVPLGTLTHCRAHDTPAMCTGDWGCETVRRSARGREEGCWQCVEAVAITPPSNVFEL